MSWTALREEPLGLDELLAAVSHSAAGGVALFVGQVRDHSEGQPVDKLEYQAYQSMAEREMAAVADEIEAQLPEVRLAVAHRVGMLEVGEIAVVCAASAPHRAEAFQACRQLIDRLKERVPIWKKELRPDGASWVGWSEPS